MRLYVATDHAGFELKEQLRDVLAERNDITEVIDLGAQSYNAEDDYPDFIAPAAEAVSLDPTGSRAIVLGGSGQGEAMLANRYKGVRAAVYYGGALELVKLSREHNNANVLSLGARFLSYEIAKQAVELWLDTPFTGVEKYIRRIEKAEDLT